MSEARWGATGRGMRLVPAAQAEPADDGCRFSPRALMLAQRWMGAVSGKWALPVLDVLARGPARYNALLGAVEPISPKVLTQTLRRLETDGLVCRDPGPPHRQPYRLTLLGHRLRDHMLDISSWAEAYALSAGPDPEG